MTESKYVSRRDFVSAAVSVAAVSFLPAHGVLAALAAKPSAAVAASQAQVKLEPNPDWKDQGILNLTHSPFAKLKNVPVDAVTIQDGFWGKRRETNVTKSIPSMEKLLLVNGRLDNFLRLEGKSTAAQRGPVYSDSDIYKWAEAVAFALQSGERPDLQPPIQQIIDVVVAAQEPSGYLNTYYQNERTDLRMQPKTQQTGHELYNMGHFLQGAIAYYRGTGDRKLLDAGIRFVDDFLIPNYGPGADKKPILSGHPEIEMGLIELYRLTGDKRQLDLAGYILHGDERIPLQHRESVYMFSGIPFTGRTHLEGHAVRAMYACCGATDYYLETGDPAYWKTLETLWHDLVTAQMYVTGGVGARGAGEAFGDDYELPNLRAYGESCAAIGNMMWNWRMLAATGDARYTDVIERALYNGINSGMSLDGTLYCYRNPLQFEPSEADKIRNPWYDTDCCPPNLERTFASLPGYFYSTSSDGIFVHLYDNSELNWHLENGTGLKVTQKTNYPWDGSVEITVTPEAATDFTFFLRIPLWTDHAQVEVNKQPMLGAKPGDYMALKRRWNPGDVIHLQLDMTPQAIAANDKVVDDDGRIALQRGPLVYCMEQMDQPQGVKLSDVALDIGSKGASGFHASFEKDVLGGVNVLRGNGVEVADEEGDALYYRYSGTGRKSRKVELTFIPYFAWANREETPMQVWTPVKT
ncbi:MAG: beta-L-arabinofuranosidase domain-containing protein [Candidatus Acidiferrales bacterium]